MMIKTRVREPWETKVEEIKKTLRNPALESDLLYLIHPGNDSAEGDVSEAARKGILEELNKSVEKEGRAILIYPMNGGVYIDSANVTDVRGGLENNWIMRFDGGGVKETTFVGGKLRKCLGYAYDDYVRSLEQLAKLTSEEVAMTINIPLGGIYSECLFIKDTFTAEDEFLAGIPVVGLKESLYALLTADNSRNNYYDKSSLEYCILSPFPDGIVELYLNNEHIATFGEQEPIAKKPQMNKEEARSKNLIYFPPEEEPEKSLIKINLCVFYDVDKTVKNNDELERYVSFRWNNLKTIYENLL